MKLLAIDTSNVPLVVAIAENQQVLAQITDNNQKEHSSHLLPAIQSVMQQVNWQPQDLDRIVVAQGPGSFTGIRIAVTTAKMLAWTLNKELVGVSSLAALARNVHNVSGLVVPFFDARHLNIFAGVYRINAQDQLTAVVSDQHISMTALLDYLCLQSDPIYFLGTGMSNFEDMILQRISNAHILSVDQARAESLITLGLNGQVVTDLNDFSPIYLRQTQAEMTWSKKHPQAINNNYIEDV